MALARFALQNLQKKVNNSVAASDGAQLTRALAAMQNYCRPMGTTEASHEAPAKASSEVAVQEAGGGRGRKFSLFPRRNRRSRSLWRGQDRDFPPPLSDFFPTGLGHALMQATENINRLFENININSPAFRQLISGRIKENDDHYKLKYNVPGLSKEDLKVTVHDGVLEIRGEHKEDDEEEDEASYYGYYYNTSLLLPEDAKADEIKAELKDGLLTVVIPRTEKPNKDVKEVEIH